MQGQSGYDAALTEKGPEVAAGSGRGHAGRKDDHCLERAAEDDRGHGLPEDFGH